MFNINYNSKNRFHLLNFKYLFFLYRNIFDSSIKKIKTSKKVIAKRIQKRSNFPCSRLMYRENSKADIQLDGHTGVQTNRRCSHQYFISRYFIPKKLHVSLRESRENIVSYMAWVLFINNLRYYHR